MKNYSKIIPIDLYARGVIICIGTKDFCVRQLRRKKVSEEYIKEVAEYDMGEVPATAVTFRIGGDVLIYMESPQPMDTLIHELSHAAFRILEIVGIDPIQSEEAYAYLLGYLYFKAADWFNGVWNSFCCESAPKQSHQFS